MDLAPGTVIAGRYRVDQKVGSGGMGEVWSGEHVAIGVRVAVKTLLKAAADHSELTDFVILPPLQQLLDAASKH